MVFEEGVAAAEGRVGTAGEDRPLPVVPRTVELEQPDRRLGIDHHRVVLERLEHIADAGLAERPLHQVVVVRGDDRCELGVASGPGDGAMDRGERLGAT